MSLDLTAAWRCSTLLPTATAPPPPGYKGRKNAMRKWLNIRSGLFFVSPLVIIAVGIAYAVEIQGGRTSRRLEGWSGVALVAARTVIFGTNVQPRSPRSSILNQSWRTGIAPSHLRRPHESYDSPLWAVKCSLPLTPYGTPLTPSSYPPNISCPCCGRPKPTSPV